jgi:hypothetical protein
MSRTIRARLLCVAAAAIVAATAAPVAAAASTTAGGPIGPNQYFVGQVNGRTLNAAIQMACFGPILPGQTGHPLPGQTVAVTQAATTTNVGYTGSAANSIGAIIGGTSSTVVIVLTAYDTPAAIPTTLTLPCAGTGTVLFQPSPNSSTARAATVPVTFVGQP